jgi:hypothetical protein
MKSTTQRNWKFWLLASVTFLVTGLMALMNLSEFVNVGILKNIGGYPFGGAGPTPWFYKTPELYAEVCLVSGLAFLLTLAFAVWALRKKMMLTLLIVFMVSLLLVLFQIGMGGDG